MLLPACRASKLVATAVVASRAALASQASRATAGAFAADKSSAITAIPQHWAQPARGLHTTKSACIADAALEPEYLQEDQKAALRNVKPKVHTALALPVS